METREEIRGKWDQVRGRVKEQWGVLNDDDLQRTEGNVDQLVGVIREKTGQQREQIEQALNDIVSQCKSTMEAAGDTVKQSMHEAVETSRQYVDRASEAGTQAYEHVSQQVEQGYHQAEDAVRRRPLESVAVAFGAGIISGVVMGMLLRGKA